MIITKHCEPKYCEMMQDGSFKIGTLIEYRTSELENGLMSDREEGIATLTVERIPVDSAVLVGQAFLSNNDFGISDRPALLYQTESNCNVFCASKGEYNRKRHENILSGNQNYESNPNVTAYIEINVGLLIRAINMAFIYTYKCPCGLKHGQVSYEGRNRIVEHTDTVGLSQEAINAHIQQAIFSKPTAFEIEEEYRIACGYPSLNAKDIKTIFSSNMPKDIKRSFAGSIIRVGSI